MIALLSLILALTLVFAQNHQFQNNSVVNIKPAQLDKPRNITDFDNIFGFLNKYTEKEFETPEKCEFGKVLKLKLDNFHSHIARGNFFVKFYLPSCIYCKLFRPIWEELASDLINETQVCIAEYDCTAGMKLCKNMTVTRVPTLILFKDGQNVETYKGTKDKKELRNFAIGIYKNLKEEISAAKRNFANISISLWLICIILIYYLQ